MEELPEDLLIKFRPNTLKTLRGNYNFDKTNEMNQAIDVIGDWIKKQKHFRYKDFDREYLERSIILNKGSIERTKRQLDRLCTLRTLLPNYFNVSDPADEFKICQGKFAHALLPKMTTDHHRVYASKFYCTGSSARFYTSCYRYAVALCEYIRTHDYCDGIIILTDFRDINTAKFVSETNPLEMRHVITIVMEGYQMRVKGIHIISESATIELLVKLVKQFLSSKVGDRIQVHKNVASVYKYIPKEILPKEWGGNEKTLPDLSDETIRVLGRKDFKEHLVKMKDAYTDESKREKCVFNDQYAGVAGSFRNLCVD